MRKSWLLSCSQLVLHRWGELAARWTKFAGISIPWLTRLVTAVLRNRLEQEQVQLAKDAVKNFERLGATYIKVGQVLSVRYDSSPQKQTGTEPDIAQ